MAPRAAEETGGAKDGCGEVETIADSAGEERPDTWPEEER